MIFNTILFYFLSIILLTSSLMVILVKNSVYSILFLILSFIMATGLLLLLNCEFMALLFIIIYVGAIAVLFLFVIMMLNIKVTNSIKDILKYFPIGNILGFIFLIEIIFALAENVKVNPYYNSFLFNIYTNWYEKIDSISDIVSLGQILYTYYILQFLVAGVILLIAVIGSVILTLKTKDKTLKTQDTFRQICR